MTDTSICRFGVTQPVDKLWLNEAAAGPKAPIADGMTPSDMPVLAQLIADGLGKRPESVAKRTSELRQSFDGIHFVQSRPEREAVSP